MCVLNRGGARFCILPICFALVALKGEFRAAKALADLFRGIRCRCMSKMLVHLVQMLMLLFYSCHNALL
jgi:hypothetical protein